MTAFYFGDRQRPLFGTFHPASGRAGGTGVVICPPFGEEAIRSFRTLRLLADALAATGLPTLRFDYFGTGDSGGDGSDFALAGALDDAVVAAAELVDMANVRHVVMIGLRVGARMAAGALAPPGEGAYALRVLWDPVIDGEDYVQSLRQAHSVAIRSMLDRDVVGDRDEALGFPLSDELVKGLAQPFPWPTGGASIVVGPSDAFLPAQTHFIPDPMSGIWDSDKALNAYVVPTQTIRLIVAAIRERV